MWLRRSRKQIAPRRRRVWLSVERRETERDDATVEDDIEKWKENGIDK